MSGNLLAYLDISADGDLLHGHGAIVFTSTTRGAGLGAGLTNVSLLQPGYPVGTDSDTLHEPALANIRGRCTVARFIGWAFAGHAIWDQPANSPPTPCDWSIRPKIGDPTYVLGGWGVSGLGVPYEMIARVANTLNVDVWLNLPSTTNETARDEYVKGVVTVFDSMLPPNRKLYIEYANECFFGNNQCYPDDTTQANITVLQQGDPYKLNLGLDMPPNATKNLISHWNPRMYTMNSLRLAQAAASVVGAARVGRSDNPNVRVVPVIGALGSYANDGEAKLSWLNAAWGAPSSLGLATMNIGAYFAADRSIVSDPNATTDAIIDSLLYLLGNSTTSAPMAYGKNAFASFSAVAAYYGVALHAYEGGPDTSGYKENGIMAAALANVDPRMADVVAGIVANWQSWTGGLFNYFQLGVQPSFQPWGSYTNLWDLRVPDTPKTRGIDRIVSSPPAPLTAGWPIPLVQHNASFVVGYYSADGMPPPTPIAFNNMDAVYNYLVRFATPCAAGINVTVTMASLMNRITHKVGGETFTVAVGSFLPVQSFLSPVTNGTAHDLMTVTALFDPMPLTALSSGLVTVQLGAPGPPTNANITNYRFWYVDVNCR